MADQPPSRVRDCYDTVAHSYGERFRNELDGKPFDRAKLDRFAKDLLGAGPVCDLGCGSGHIAGYLAARGVDVFGLDLSTGQVEEARRQFPDLRFRQADMMALDEPDQSVAGIVAFYSIVHFSPAQLDRALREMHRVLEPGGRLLLSFHIGTEPLAVDEFLGHTVSIDFSFFEVDDVRARLGSAGFDSIEAEQRAPYPDVEAQTQRAYLQARRRPATSDPQPA